MFENRYDPISIFIKNITNPKFSIYGRIYSVKNTLYRNQAIFQISTVDQTAKRSRSVDSVERNRKSL